MSARSECDVSSIENSTSENTQHGGENSHAQSYETQILETKSEHASTSLQKRSSEKFCVSGG
jgi:hypothetical protein